MTTRAFGARALVLLAVATGALLAAPLVSGRETPAFPHAAHATLFPLCTSCHAGIVDAGAPTFPTVASCASCHDGDVESRVEWAPRVGPRPTNLTFAHDTHQSAVVRHDAADSTLNRTCATCHVAGRDTGRTARMTVQRAVVAQCLDCHGLTAPHVDVAPENCATCHVRLTDAPGLTTATIAAFPRPTSHAAPNWKFEAHGRIAQGTGAHGGPTAVAANCATCHARNLCITCHVNAPEVAAIAALALDDRSPRYAAKLSMPPDHSEPRFLRQHGPNARRSDATCATCHARESCTTCHVGAEPRGAEALHTSGPGRAPGASLTRTPPASHTEEFRERHGREANARPQSCESCHVRSTCLECHRPEPGGRASYHPQNFLTRHPSSAYAREANCTDCHNPGQFCQSCHLQSGLVATGRLGRTGYHDAFRGFSLGHGQAARQSLESCAACHAERDCTACHSAVGGGFRFNPHGPGFNAARAMAKNPSTCIACHGRVIPGVP